MTTMETTPSSHKIHPSETPQDPWSQASEFEPIGHHGAARLWSRADQRQQHHGRLGSHERVGCLRSHVEPGTGAEIQLLTIDGETEQTRHDLNHG